MVVFVGMCHLQQSGKKLHFKKIIKSHVFFMQVSVFFIFFPLQMVATDVHFNTYCIYYLFFDNVGRLCDDKEG